jgi:hypothetical protein
METMEQSTLSGQPPKKDFARSKFDRFELPPTEFYLGIQKDIFWIPENISPWFYLHSYQALPVEVRRRYNQLYALATNEVFAIFEKEFICPILQQLAQTPGLSDEKKFLLDGFCREEIKHAEMFNQLNLAAEPKYYQQNTYFISRNAHPSGVFTLDQIKKYPQIFGVWVWIALLFEERSLMYSKEYLKDKTGSVSSHFKQIHHWHMLEEVHHVQLDEFLANEFYRPLAPWKRWLTARMMSSVIRSFQSPRRISLVIAKMMKDEFKEISIHQKIDDCVKELPKLRRNHEFQNKVFGAEAMARTRNVMSSYVEMNKLLSLFETSL